MEIRELTTEEFTPIFDQYRPQVFTDTLYFYARDVRTQHEVSCFEKLQAGVSSRYQLNLVMFDGEQVVGWTSAHQFSAGELYMMNSAVLPQYRRKGYYKQLMFKVLEKAREEGYQLVSSLHLASNNDVIIPKLQAGFHIVGTEVTDQFGVFVRLNYFINETRRNMYLFRTGAKRLTPEMSEIFGRYEVK